MQKFKFLVLVFTLVLFAGCSGNLFKGLESKGGSTQDKIMDAKMLLEDAKTPADYANAAIQIQAVLTSGAVTSGTEQYREVQIDYATAKLGEAGIDMVAVATAVTSASAGQKQDLEKIKDILTEAFKVTNVDSSTNATITSADEFNKAFQNLIGSMENTSPKALTAVTDAEKNATAAYRNQALTAAIANACAAIFTILKEFDTNPKDGKIENNEVPTDPAFTTRWNKPDVGPKVLKHVRNAIRLAICATVGSGDDIEKIENAVKNLEDKLDPTKNPALRQDIIDYL